MIELKHFIQFLNKVKGGIETRNWDVIEKAYEEMSGDKIDADKIVANSVSVQNKEQIILEFIDYIRDGVIEAMTGINKEDVDKQLAQYKANSTPANEFNINDYEVVDDDEKLVPSDPPGLYARIPKTPPRPAERFNYTCGKCHQNFEVEKEEHDNAQAYGLDLYCHRCS